MCRPEVLELVLDCGGLINGGEQAPGGGMLGEGDEGHGRGPAAF